jgi:hypothetical protein
LPAKLAADEHPSVYAHAPFSLLPPARSARLGLRSERKTDSEKKKKKKKKVLSDLVLDGSKALPASRRPSLLIW